MHSDIVTCPSCGQRNRLRSSDPLSSAPDNDPQTVPQCGACGTALPWLIHASDGDFAREIASKLPVLVDFWAPWCGPCHAVAPVVDDLAQTYAGRLKVLKVDIDQSPHTAAGYRVQSIPTLVLFRDGRPVHRAVGVQSRRELARAIEPHL